MKRIAIGSIAVVAAMAVAAGGAFGASSKPFQATAGLFKTSKEASSEVSKLSAKGFSGYTTETEKRGQFSAGKKYEVAKDFATQKLAKAEVSKLHKKGFKGAAVETEKSEKASA